MTVFLRLSGHAVVGEDEDVVDGEEDYLAELVRADVSHFFLVISSERSSCT